MLKFLSKHEVKLTAAASAPYFVEAVAPVYAKESEHRQIYSRTHTGASFEIEGREVAHGSPAVARFGEDKGIDGGGGLKHEWEVKLESEASVGVAFIAPWSELAIVVAAHGHCLCGICIGSRHAVATEVEGLKGSADVAVVAAEQREVRSCHEHQCPLSVRVSERGICA